MAESKIFYATQPVIPEGDWNGKTTFSCCGETELGTFTKKLIPLMKLIMRRQENYNCFCKIEDLMKQGYVCGGK